jgi:hypothetical protein
MATIERPRLEVPTTGRPSTYCTALADEVLAHIAGGESLRQACQAAGMPHRSTVVRWLVKREDFAARYQQARAMQLDAWLDEIMDHMRSEPARDPATGRMDPASVRHHRNQLGSWKWFMDKLRSRPRPAST